MYAHPWAIHHVGTERSLDALSACSVDGLQLALAYHAASYVSPLGNPPRVLSGDLGALQFDPVLVRSNPWPVDPPVAHHAIGQRTVPKILDACEARGIRVIAWVVYLYNHAVARSNPELAVRNVFGDSSGAQLCPANPTVMAYVRTLTRTALDLGAFYGLHVESLCYLPFNYGMWNLKTAVRPNDEAGQLLSLCFCNHCIDEARRRDISVERFSRSVRRWLDAYLKALPDAVDRVPAFGDDDASTLMLDAYVNMRSDLVVRAQGEVLDLASTAGLFFSSNVAEDDSSLANGSAVQSMRSKLDSVRVRVRAGAAPADIRAAAALVTHGTRPNVPVYADYELAAFGSEAELLHAVDAAKMAGLRHHRYYEFSLLTRRHLAWLEAVGTSS